MNRLRLKYQQFFTTLLLLIAYLVGNFSLPLFEAVHLLMHLGDDTAFHSYQSHDTQHQHQLLINLDDLMNSSSDSDLPFKNTSKKQVKKFVQQVVEISSFLLMDFHTNTTNFANSHFAFPLPFLSISSPPPEV